MIFVTFSSKTDIFYYRDAARLLSRSCVTLICTSFYSFFFADKPEILRNPDRLYIS